MKKYKLIKKYPGSPKLGTILNLRKSIVGGPYYSAYLDCMNSIDFDVELIENDPEFWELVVEKEYEILSFKGRASDSIYYLVNNHYCLKECTTGNPLEYNLKSQLYDIHSIKRLSDGEVFTVGDKIDGPCGKNQEITKIDTDWIYYLNTKNVVYTYRLSDIKKAKKPLFKTEDGVDIFEGQQYWYINNINSKLYIINIGTAIKDSQLGKKVDGILDFSTKEAAEEYVLMNKPCLSINDFYSFSSCQAEQENTHRKLKELVKSRL